MFHLVFRPHGSAQQDSAPASPSSFLTLLQQLLPLGSAPRITHLSCRSWATGDVGFYQTGLAPAILTLWWCRHLS